MIKLLLFEWMGGKLSSCADNAGSFDNGDVLVPLHDAVEC
jgi:hypothetical protein